MFEDSLVESRVATPSSTKRWMMAGSTALQVAIAATLVVIPLLHPERLAFHFETPVVFTPPQPRPPVPVQTQRANASASTDIPVPFHPLVPIAIRDPRPSADDPPAIGRINMMGTSDGIPSALVNNPGTPVTVVRAQPAKRITVSNGVTAGLLLAPIRPVYPTIAKAAGVSGTVVVEAIISKTGTIESLHVASGPAMLREAALDAIRTARYRPYLLNGEPTEIQTTFTINFRIGG